MELRRCQCKNRHSFRIVHIQPLVTWRNEKPEALSPGPLFDQEPQDCKHGQQRFPGMRSASVLVHPLKAATLSPPLKNSLRQAARTIPRRAIESNAFSLFSSNMSGFPYRSQLLELLVSLFFTTLCIKGLFQPHHSAICGPSSPHPSFPMS